MALSPAIDGAAVESHPLQVYQGISNIRDSDHSRSSSLHSGISSSGEDEASDTEGHPEPARLSHEHLIKKETSKERLGFTAPPIARAGRLVPNTHPPGAKRTSNVHRILLHGLARCVISWILMVGFYLSLWLYKDRVISPRTKSTFDAINIGLSIAFGLNIASSLKSVALDVRWWILDLRRKSRRPTSFPEVSNYAGLGTLHRH